MAGFETPAYCLVLFAVFHMLGSLSVAEHHEEKTLPVWEVPEDKDLHRLGKKENWGDLERLLAPFKINEPDNGEFYVEDEATEAHLNFVRNEIDTTVNTHKDNLLSYLFIADDNDDLLKQLLVLGVNPDRPDGSNRRPSHMCGYRDRLKMARALSLCRPLLTAKDNWQRTPLEVARHENRADVAEIWENLEKTGNPSLAQLAHDQQWFAVQNLCRRKAVGEEEVVEKFNGKNAIEWASHHGRKGLARELKYLFPGAETNGSSAESNLMHEAVTLAGGSACTKVESLVDELGVKIGSELENLQSTLGSQFSSGLRKVDDNIEKLTSKIEGLEWKIEQLGKKSSGH